MRDKAWFFLSRGEVSTNQRDKTLDGQIFNVSSELFASVVKLNFQPGAKHSLAYTFIDAPVDRIFRCRRWVTSTWPRSTSPPAASTACRGTGR